MKFKCPKCNGTNVEMDSNLVLLSLPPQYKFKCLNDKCKHEYTSNL